MKNKHKFIHIGFWLHLTLNTDMKDEKEKKNILKNSCKD